MKTSSELRCTATSDREIGEKHMLSLLCLGVSFFLGYHSEAGFVIIAKSMVGD